MREKMKNIAAVTLMILLIWPAGLSVSASESVEPDEIVPTEETETETEETETEEPEALPPEEGSPEELIAQGMRLFSIPSPPLPGAGAPGDSTWQEGFEYTLDEAAGTVTLTRYTGADTAAVTIPAEAVIGGTSYRTVIDHPEDNSPFFGSAAAAIEQVTVESGVIINGMSSLFQGCMNLLTITLPAERVPLPLPDYYCPCDGVSSDESVSYTNLSDIPEDVSMVQKKRSRVGSDYIVRVPASVDLLWEEDQFTGSFDITVEMDRLDSGDYVEMLLDDLDDPAADGVITLSDGTGDLLIRLESETTSGSEIRPHIFEKAGGPVTRHITLTSDTGLSESDCSGRLFSGGVNVTYRSGRKWTL